MGVPTWLDDVNNIYHNRDARAKALKKEGRKVIGYLCSFVPLEIFTAADIIPYRITGRLKEPISEAHDYLEPNACPYVLNCFQCTIKGEYDFLDGLVIPHSCDTVQRIYGILKFWRPKPFMHFLSTPTVVDSHSRQFFKEELEMLKESLEKYTGSKIHPDKLDDAINLHNKNRNLIKDLYNIRKKNPCVLSSSVMTKILVAGVSMPADEFNCLLKQIQEDVAQNVADKEEKGVRLLLYGCIVDHEAISEVAERAGGAIVVDDTCIGTRSYWNLVPLTENPFEGLTQAYFANFMCPKLIRSSHASRFQYLADMASEFEIKGVIAYLLSYCDLHKFDVPDLKEFMAAAGYPMLIIEDDYTMSAEASIQNRIQTFVEILE